MIAQKLKIENKVERDAGWARWTNVVVSLRPVCYYPGHNYLNLASHTKTSSSSAPSPTSLPSSPTSRPPSLTLSPPSSPVRYAKFESIRYFIDIDIWQNCLIDINIDIDIFQNHHIDIDIFGIALSISIFFRIALSISISIFSKMTISILISISIFFKSVDISTIDMSYRCIEQG